MPKAADGVLFVLHPMLCILEGIPGVSDRVLHVLEMVPGFLEKMLCCSDGVRGDAAEELWVAEKVVRAAEKD